MAIPVKNNQDLLYKNYAAQLDADGLKDTLYWSLLAIKPMCNDQYDQLLWLSVNGNPHWKLLKLVTPSLPLKVKYENGYEKQKLHA